MQLRMSVTMLCREPVGHGEWLCAGLTRAVSSVDLDNTRVTHLLDRLVITAPKNPSQELVVKVDPVAMITTLAREPSVEGQDLKEGCPFVSVDPRGRINCSRNGCEYAPK